MRSHPSAVGHWRKRQASVRRTLLKPPPRLSLSEWAERYRVLSPEASAEPGPWRNDRAPYLKGIMDALSDPRVERVVAKLASQVGKTEIANNLVGFHIHQDPAPILVVQPSLAMAETWSKDRLAPMLRDSPALRDKVKDPRSRDSGNTILHKNFPGGHLTIVGANSAAGLASRPIRILVLDEVDRYPDSAGSEGDPVNLAEQRQATFWNRKSFLVSSPGIHGESRIDDEYQLSDQRRYYVPCPHCETMQVLQWENVRWEKEVTDGRKIHRPQTAAYECAACHAVIDEADKLRMVRMGEWRAGNPDGQYPGFQLSSLYSPFVSWAKMAAQWLKDYRDQEQRKTFVNTKLGETFKPDEQDFDPASLDGRRETWTDDDGKPVDVPDGVGVLTSFVDVQTDRLEVAVWGWGMGEESWLITHERIPGDPEKPEVWARLEAVRTKLWTHASGQTLRLYVMGVDAGYLSPTVYAWVRPRERANTFAVLGRDERLKEPLSPKPSPNKYGVKPWTVATTTYKDVLFRRLRLAEPGPGYIHLCRPTVNGADSEFIAQFAAEIPEVRRVRGRLVRGYKQIRDRNEAIDLYVGGRAMLHTTGPTVLAQLDGRARKLSERVQKVKAEPEPQTKPHPVTVPRRRNWVRDY